MNTERKCPECGISLPADAPAGLCPRCLLQSASVTQSASEGGSGGGTIASTRPTPGSQYGGYQILRLLGRGGMGEVYEADHLESGRRVALKVMNHSLTSETDRLRFLREGRLAASVSHPNVIYVFGSEEIEGVPVIAMELVHEGTLKDVVRKRGPLPVGEAVEQVLQVIAGLEAANTTGVLHRDIKPGNCFVGVDGTVKVGDFGLSISTLARPESMVTTAGSVLGTPGMASPEQLRGEELDVRSDIYSVGATLYYLLTGKLPFLGDDMVQLIANVLDQPPKSPAVHRPDLPSGLVRIILRCLAKERAKRFTSYTELADALRPFDETETEPAGLGKRTVAYLLDSLIASLPMFVAIAQTGYAYDDPFLAERTVATGLWLLAQMMFGWTYFTVAEGIWGGGFGKALCGIRVVSPDGSAPGLGRALGRVAIFELSSLIPMVVVLMTWTGEQYRKLYHDSDFLWTDWLMMVVTLLFFCTMRRSNGFAAIYDLATGTRVVRRELGEHRPTCLPIGMPLRSLKGPGQIGPYAIIGQVADWNDESLLLAHDPALRRDVWIHRKNNGESAVSARRRECARPTRLRWLNGRTDDGEYWDAFEAPAGRPLLDVVTAPQSWTAVRFWLRDLVEEFQAMQDDGEAEMSLDHAWVREDGRLLVLDFPAPGVESKDPGRCTSLESLQQGLAKLADRAHVGDLHEAPIKGPRPLAAQSFVQRLKAGAFESLPVLLGNLQSLTRQSGQASGRLRVGGILMGLIPAVFLSLAMYFTMTNEARRWDSAWREMFAERPTLRHALLADVGALDAAMVQQIILYTGSEYADLLTNSAFWADGELGRQLITEEREYLTNAVALVKYTESSELEAARRQAREIVRRVVGADHEIAMESGLMLFLIFYSIAALFRSFP